MTSPPDLPATLHIERPRPPPLPPRDSLSTQSPPPYSVMAMSSKDPRSSSTQSLVPDSTLDNAGRRRLLLVYIHGFMGNETSFRSFPAHVHNLVTVTLSESHVVHTKIYPRYRSRNTLSVARDDFSKWLAPHEDPWTDVILLGHSMGGLLAADIALVFRHRIVGIVNFDVPFLGMHPGIVKAGLGSLFSPAPTPQDVIVQDPGASKKPSRMGTLFNPKPSDPNYNPSFSNDVQLPMRKGWENTLHWLTKHYNDGLRQATKGLVKSHFEFGSAMADYRELKDRYAKVRALEEEDDEKRSIAYSTPRSVPRIRFVNYYTASTGRPKKPKSPKSSRSPSPSSRHSSQNRSSSHRVPNETDSAMEQQSQHRSSDSDSIASSHTEMTHVHPDPIMESPRTSCDRQERGHIGSVPSHTQNPIAAVESGVASEAPNLPDIPPIPTEPPFVDLLQMTDKAERKAAEKEHDRALKEYQKAVKSRNKAINERTRLQERWEKQQQQAREKQKELEEEAEKNKSPETRMREAEARQRQAEAVQRQKEAEGRMTDAEREAAGLNRPPKPKTAAGSSRSIDEHVEAINLGDGSVPGQSSQGPYAHYDFSRSAIMNQVPPDDRSSSLTDSGYTLSTTNSQASHPPTSRTNSGTPAKSQKPKKLGKFCMLPPKDAQGNKDPTWVRVLMEGMDEVTAHTSLFFVNDTYERLVGDVGDRIEDWIREADSVRLVREMSGL
ncbi:hypothetical protein NX059_007056 [Plenodomus lindquistii]|nr:hypothetical protein NX059_007056 [Plenodomus lindquistii]